MFEKRPTNGSPKERRKWFWQWFLMHIVLSSIDLENMSPEMECSFKYAFFLEGRVIFFRDRQGELRALPFKNGGGVPVYFNQIVETLVTNPVIGDYRFKEGESDNCTVYLTFLDRMQLGRGFWDLIDTFSDDLSENDLSIKMVQVIKRMPTVFIGYNDNDYAAINNLIQSVVDGETALAVKSSINDMIQRLDASDTKTQLSEFTEYQQYKLGQFYGMLGVNAVWNMKREAVAASENKTSGETARFNISDIADNLNNQLNTVNERFGTNFHAELNIIQAAELAGEIDEIVSTGEDESETQDNESEESEGNNGGN